MDSYILAAPNGSQIDIGSYLAVDRGQPDFGAKDLIAAIYNENPNAEGGALAYESVGVRKFSFPVRLASSNIYAQGLTGLESILRQLARPNSTIDLIPDGVATGNLVRFDVLGGRYEEDYSTYLQRVGRREGTLKLEVTPFGYSPSWITLASTASVALPGVLAVPGASVLGDVPGWAEIVMQATTPTNFPAGTWIPDFAAWSLAGQASFSAFWPAASLASLGPATAITDAFAPGGAAIGAVSTTAWSQVVVGTIGAALEPAFRGRYRGWLWAKSPSAGMFQLSMDAAVQPGAALASAAWVATMSASAFAHPSPAYQLLDMGELTLPPVGSGLSQNVQLRVWASKSSGTILSIGGLYLQPLDGPAGILPRGLGQPTILNASSGRLYLDSYTKRALIAQPTGDMGSAPYPAAAAQTWHLGGLPYVGGSTLQLDLLGGSRKVASGATAPLVRDSVKWASVSVRYRPRFAFLKAI